MAYVSKKKAGLEPFALQVPSFEKQIKAIQRKQERSRRTNNPDYFQPDDIVLKGKKGGRKVKVGVGCQWNNSHNYDQLGLKRRSILRRKTAYVLSLNRSLANKILREAGKHVSLENVSVKGWQKRYGKAICTKSPGFFQSELCRKAESAGAVIHLKKSDTLETVWF